MVGSTSKRDRMVTWLRVGVLGGALLLLAGVLVECVVELSTAEWIGEATAPSSFPGDPRIEKWFSRLERDGARLGWTMWMVPLGAGTLAGSLASLAWLSGFRFGLRSLMMGMLYVGVLLGIPLGLVRPRLQNPVVSYRAVEVDLAFSQMGPGSAHSASST